MNENLPASARELTDDDWALLALAEHTIESNTDADPGQDGRHTMAAALVAGDGSRHSAVNLYHFTGGPCAELVVLAAARAAGARDPQVIVAVGNHGRGVKSPCGRCRQVIADAYPTIRVIVPTSSGPRSVAAEDLLPLAFDHAAEQISAAAPHSADPQALS
ncbi:cytidine/deoxycytidylate deaminase family protein [Glutamicibacter sp. X7]